MNDLNAFGLYDKKCPICGKRFFARSDWAYRRRYFNKSCYYCSYSCLVKADEEYEKRLADKKRETAIKREAKKAERKKGRFI